MRPYLDALDGSTDAFSGHNTRRAGSLVARSTASHELITHPVVLGVCDRILGANATTYQLHVTQVIDIGPGEPAQPLHRDQWAWDMFPFPHGFEVEISTIWALDDFTEANGATRVVPGSNTWDDDRAKEALGDTDMAFRPAEMPAGSVVIYSGSVLHSGGENRTDGRRRALNIDYCLGWLRQEENQYLACPPEIARTLPDDLAKLIGYSRAAYALGYYGDTQDPMSALHPDRDSPPASCPAAAAVRPTDRSAVQLEQ